MFNGLFAETVACSILERLSQDAEDRFHRLQRGMFQVLESRVATSFMSIPRTAV